MAVAMALDMESADFERRFAALLAAKRESSADVDAAAAAIIEDVRARGDEALADYSLRFDRVDVARLGLEIGAAEIEAAVAACDRTALEALKLAHDRVTDYHRRQKPADLRSSTRSASSSAGAGGRSTRSAFMFRAARRAIRPRW